MLQQLQVEMGKKYGMVPSETYADFYSGEVVVQGICYGDAVPSAFSGHIDILEQERKHYSAEDYAIEMAKLKHGIWVGYVPVDGSEPLDWVPQDLFIQHVVAL